MGCRDVESNFQTMVFENGKWWCQWGPLCYEADDFVVLREALKDSNRHWDVTFDMAKNRHVAIPGEGPNGIFVKM